MASSAASGGTGQIVSPPTRNPSRLVARRRSPGHRRNKCSATSAAAVITCSQLSSTINRSCSPISSASRFGSGRSSADAIAAGNAGRVADRSELDQVPAEAQPFGHGPSDLERQPASCPLLRDRRG